MLSQSGELRTASSIQNSSLYSLPPLLKREKISSIAARLAICSGVNSQEKLSIITLPVVEVQSQFISHTYKGRQKPKLHGGRTSKKLQSLFGALKNSVSIGDAHQGKPSIVPRFDIHICAR